MRVNELSRELGKTNKEVLDLLKKQGYDVKSHSSNINSDQIDAVKRCFSERPAQREQVQKERTGKAEAARVEEIKREPVRTEADGNGTAEPPKKRITAVYRPQNSTAKGTGSKAGGQRTGRQGQGASSQGNRDGQNRGYGRDGQGNRDGQNRGYGRDSQGNRDGQNRMHQW